MLTIDPWRRYQLHPDHRAVAAAVSDVCTGRATTLRRFAYEIWAPLHPTHVVDIGSVWDRKRTAIEQYRSQLAYNDYLHKISGLNAYRSLHLPSTRYVEAFASPDRS